MSKSSTARDNLMQLILADENYFIARPTSPEQAPATPGGPVPVVTQKQGDVTNMIAIALQKIGVGVAVMSALDIDLVDPQTPETDVKDRFAVMVTENVPVNQARDTDGNLVGSATGKEGQDIVEKIVSLVHFKPNGVTPGDETRPGRFIVTGARQLEPHAQAPTVISYQINITTQFNIS